MRAQEFQRLREAYLLAPASPIGLRAVAHFHEKRGEAQALSVYEKLVEHPEATTDDRIHASRLAVRAGRFDLARRLLAILDKEEAARGLPSVQMIHAELLAAEGSGDAALALARQAVAQAGDRAPEKLALASLLLRVREDAPEAPRFRSEALDLLSELTLRPDAIGLDALSLLISLARSPGGPGFFSGRDAGPWVAAAEGHPRAKAAMKIAAWDLSLATQPAARERTFAAFMAKWQAASAPEQLEAVRWLNQRGQNNLALELSTPRQQNSEDWFFVHLDALSASGRWADVLGLLQQPTGQAAQLPKALRSLFELRAQIELKQPVKTEDAWRDIQVQLLQETIRNQLYVAGYAERMGERGEAVAIYRRLLTRAESSGPWARTL